MAEVCAKFKLNQSNVYDVIEPQIAKQTMSQTFTFIIVYNTTFIIFYL